METGQTFITQSLPFHIINIEAGLVPFVSTNDAPTAWFFREMKSDKEVVLNAENLHTPITFSSFEGMRVRGYPITTINRGKVIVNNGTLIAEPGRGQFLERSYE